MIRIQNIKYPLTLDESNLPEYIAKKYGIAKMKDFRIIKQSVDARKKNDINYIYTVDISAANEDKLIKRYKNIQKPQYKGYKPPKFNGGGKTVVVAGFGPAGIMAAYILSKSGFKVIVLERGEKVEERIKSVDKLKKHGKLNTQSNVQFGEGGAGTFSDGKLTTGVNDIRCAYVLDEFAKHGAPHEITYKAKPHIGTDKLVNMVKAFREDIIKSGGELRFLSKLTDIKLENGAVKSVTVNDEYEIKTDILVLACGHSAVDVFEMMKRIGADMERKVFAIGARIEHLQDKINYAQYGKSKDFLGAADYKLSYKTLNGKTVYTFCMCPGGEVVASASEDGGVVTNGMSRFARDGVNANSALLVNVTPSDLYGEDVLEGCRFQREIERKAYAAGGGGYAAPCQTVGDFLYENRAKPTIMPTYKPGVKYCTLDSVLPKFVTDALREAIPEFDKKLSGFAADGAVLTAPETRSSSPVRIIRDADTMMSSICGIYPCGEGAGYAGGIMTAAVDGIKVAEAVLKRSENNVAK